MVVLGITLAGYYKVQPLPLQTLPFAQTDCWYGMIVRTMWMGSFGANDRSPDERPVRASGILCGKIMLLLLLLLLRITITVAITVTITVTITITTYYYYYYYYYYYTAPGIRTLAAFSLRVAGWSLGGEDASSLRR